jgi:hypothetical protein
VNPILVGLGIVIAGMAVLIVYLAWRADRRPSRAASSPQPEIIRIHSGSATWLLYRIDLFFGGSVWVDVTGRLYDVDVKTKQATRVLPLPAPPTEVTPSEWADQVSGVLSGLHDPQGRVFDVGPSAWAELGLDASVDHVGTLMDRAYEDGKQNRQVPSEGTYRAMVKLRRMLDKSRA